jgi:hypothetical protein
MIKEFTFGEIKWTVKKDESKPGFQSATRPETI